MPPGPRCPERSTRLGGYGPQFYLTDRQGSVLQVITPSGETIKRLRYEGLAVKWRGAANDAIGRDRTPDYQSFLYKQMFRASADPGSLPQIYREVGRNTMMPLRPLALGGYKGFQSGDWGEAADAAGSLAAQMTLAILTRGFGAARGQTVNLAVPNQIVSAVVTKFTL